ncbi:CDP-glycerol glycerophosphotransferase family protein [Photobacterium makurazakiensis]|uniref:CDP-glycerol glycerophosphotransferase family protein n=1 Tax=Photobacterium makurazakiensis TaxID=2910234 RepID=UPI003D09A3AF
MWSISNKNKFLIQRFIDAASGFILSLFFIFGKRQKRIIFNSTVNKDFTFNSKYLFINEKDNFEKAGYEVKFIINDFKRREQLKEIYGDYFISSKGLKQKKYILNASCWIMSTMDAPITGLFMNHSRLVIQLGHGTPIKNIGLMDQSASLLKKLYYRMMSTNITYYLSPSEFFAEYIGKAFGVKQNQVLIARQPRLDSMSSGKSEFIESFRKNKETKLILYTPTWRPYSDVKLFPFPDYNKETLEKTLKEENTVIFLRLHPKFEVNLSEYLNDNVINLDSSKAEDITEHLDQFDALLTDYSSIYCDFAMLNKPVGFVPYDLKEYEENVGFSHDYKELTWGGDIKKTSDIVKLSNIYTKKKVHVSTINKLNENGAYSILTELVKVSS